MKRKYKKQLKLVLSMPTMGGKILRRNFIKIFDQDIDFQYLEARGLIEYSHKTQDSSGYKVWFVVLTKNGLTYFDKHWEERWHFIVRSFFCPNFGFAHHKFFGMVFGVVVKINHSTSSRK